MAEAMIRTTLGDVRKAVARVAGMSGMSVTDPRITERINESQQELMNEGDFPGVVDRWHIVTDGGDIVLPPHLDRLMQISIAGTPRRIPSPWFEFVDYGPGNAEDRCDCNRTWCDSYGILDRGETPTTNQLPDPDVTAGPWQLRFYPKVTELPDTNILVQGLGADGDMVRTQLTTGSDAGEWINGESISISDGTFGGVSSGTGITSGSSFYQSTQSFTSLDVLTKPVTNGYVYLTAWNGVTEVDLSNYAPNETTPSYRRYFSPWLQDRAADTNGCRVVRARCRRRFVPVAKESDVLIISNVLALKEMVIAQNKREAGVGDEYALHKQTAVDILRKEAAGYRGRSRIPGITFQRGFSIGSLPGVR